MRTSEWKSTSRDIEELGRQEPEVRSFQINRDAVADLKRPDIDPYADVKSRITALESIVLFQGEVNPLTVALSDDLNVDLYKIEAKVLRLIVLNQEKVAKEIDDMRSHYDHRFDLQLADNLRNVQQISSLKATNIELRRKLEITTHKLQQLQVDFDGTECLDIDR